MIIKGKELMALRRAMVEYMKFLNDRIDSPHDFDDKFHMLIGVLHVEDSISVRDSTLDIYIASCVKRISVLNFILLRQSFMGLEDSELESELDTLNSLFIKLGHLKYGG